MRSVLRGAALAALLISAQNARAEGFAIERYEPNPAGSWFFGVVHPWYSSTRWLAAGLTLDYAHDPLLAGLYDAQGNFHKTAAVVEHSLVGHIDVAGSFLDRVQINGSLPITLLERGTPQFGVSPLDGAAVGDPRFGLFVRLWGQADKDPVSIHLGGYVWIPVGANNSHQGDPTARGLPEVILAGLIKKHVRYAFNLGFLIREQSSIGFGRVNASGTELQASLGVAYADVERRFQIGPELWFGTVIVGGHAFQNGFSSLDVLLGGQYNIAHLINIGAAVGAGTLSELGAADARVIFRLAYAPIREAKKAPPPPPPPPLDSDHDGIPDSEDLCPGEAPGAKADPKRPGCPFVDKDNDGIPDAEDLC